MSYMLVKEVYKNLNIIGWPLIFLEISSRFSDFNIDFKVEIYNFF